MKKVLLVATLVLSLTFLFAQGNITRAAMSWETQISGVADDYTLFGVSAATRDIVLIGGYEINFAGFYALKRTSDAGNNWESAGTLPGVADAVYDVSTYYNSEDGKVYAAAAEGGTEDGYLYTDDLESVVTWDSEDITANYWGYGVDQVDADTAYIVGEDFMASESAIDRLESAVPSPLVNTSSLGHYLSKIDCIDEDSCWTVGTYSDMGTDLLAYTTDSGTKFSGGSVGLAYLYGIDMLSDSLGYAVGGSGGTGKVVKCDSSCNDVANWSILDYDFPGNLQGITCTDDDTCWVAGDGGIIYKTEDGGDNWSAEDSNTTENLQDINCYSPGRCWAVGANGAVVAQLDETAPVTTASPAGATYTEAQTVTLSAVDTESDVDATYYTTDGTDPTTGSSVYSTPLEISETTTLKFFSVDNTGNEESVNTEEYIINITPTPTPTPEPTPEPTPTDTTEDYAGGELKIKDIELDKTYHNTKNNTDFYFYRKPTREFSVRKKLYIKVLRKSGYKKAFKRKKAFKTHYKLKLNVGKAKKNTWPNVKKRMKYKVALRYTDAQLAKKQGIKEKNLRLFIKDRKNLWRGPYTVYQNRSTNTFKFKIRNFKHLNELASISSTNRTFSPTFYFRDLKKVRFVIATKKAFRKNYPFNLADQNNYDFE